MTDVVLRNYSHEILKFADSFCCVWAMCFCVCQAGHCRTSLEAARTRNTELTEQIEQYAQKLKDVNSVFAYDW